MIEKISEKEVEREIEELLKVAEDYLWRAKTNTSKDSQNFEIVLAQEYATKASDKSSQLLHIKEFYNNVNKRVDVNLLYTDRIDTREPFSKVQNRFSLMRQKTHGCKTTRGGRSI